MKNYSSPQSKKEIQIFLGMTSYFRRFIANYAAIALPLTKMLRKSEEFNWKKEQQQSFEVLKNKLILSPILSLPDMQKEFSIMMDASKNGHGSVLMQEYNERFYLIAYASRIINSYKSNYSTYELEALGLLYAIKIWRCYLYGTKFKIITDNRALSFIQNNKNLSARVSRWCL